MGLVSKQYLRYVPGSMFGIVGCGNGIHFITRLNQKGKFVVVPACEKLFIWDLRKKVKVLTLQCENVKGTVTVVAPRPPSKGSIDNSHIAVGYSEGTLVLYDSRVGQAITFNGHRGGVSTVAWDHVGMRVASGSEDGEIVVWDVVSERGIVRLRGHKGRINKICFLETKNILVSCAHDFYIKFWDLDTNHCFCTLAKHHTDVWDMLVIKNDTRLIAAGANAELKVWGLEFPNPLQGATKELESIEEQNKEIEPVSKMIIIDTKENDGPSPDKQEITEDTPYIKVKDLGRIVRSKSDRVRGLVSDGHTIAVYGKSEVVDLFVILTPEEVNARVEKRINKSRKRARASELEVVEEELREIVLADEIRKIPSFKALHFVNGVSVLTAPDGTIQISTLHIDNSIAFYQSHVDARNKKESNEKQCIQELSLHAPAHRTEIRMTSFNSIGDQLITASSDSIKVWHKLDNQVLRTITCDYPLCLALPPGDRHALIGTKFGHLQLFDLATGALLEDFQAHDQNETSREKGIWSLALMHDGRGFVSGGSDCLVKFWNFELIDDAESGRGKRLTIVQDPRALKLADMLTCVRYSNAGKYLAVATFDLKESIYYTDSLKLVHEFYGKSMPATCLDFSADDTLIVTGCKDSCIRIFATDFGDQKKLIKNCHRGGVSEVRFIANTHMFFSCGHDGMVKQWDADNFQRIITLNGHFGIIRCLAISPNGAYVATCGQDRSIRYWDRTNEPLVLEDEREEERRRKEEQEDGAIEAPVVLGEKDAMAVRPTKTSAETERAVDQLLEALTIYREQKEAGPKGVPNQLMNLIYKTEDPLRFVLLVLRKIKSSELEEAILVLPLNKVLVLLVCLKGMVNRDWDIELVTRVLVIAVRINLPQLIASKEAISVVRAISETLPKKTLSLQDTIGFNLAGLRHMQHRIEDKAENKLFAEAATRVKERRIKKKKKDRTVKRALLTL